MKKLFLGYEWSPKTGRAGLSVVLDAKGETATRTTPARRRRSKVKILNPFNLHAGLADAGCNPLALLDREKPDCEVAAFPDGDGDG